MSPLSKEEAGLLKRLDELETDLLVERPYPPQELLGLVSDLRMELIDCWNIIADLEGRRFWKGVR
jgi:hypothetical protein